MGKIIIQMFPHCTCGLFLNTDILSHCTKNKDQGNLQIFKREEVKEGGNGNTGIVFLIYL